MYVKAPNQIVETFPYSIGDLRRDNPNTSFPRNPSDAVLADWDVYPVTVATQPTLNPGEIAELESTPTYINGAWIVNWTVRNLTQDETDGMAFEARSERDRLLLNSDWTQLPDSPLDATSKSAWADYRQDLRDITSQTTFPYVITWPTAP